MCGNVSLSREDAGGVLEIRGHATARSSPTAVRGAGIRPQLSGAGVPSGARQAGTLRAPVVPASSVPLHVARWGAVASTREGGGARHLARAVAARGAGLLPGSSGYSGGGGHTGRGSRTQGHGPLDAACSRAGRGGAQRRPEFLLSLHAWLPPLRFSWSRVQGPGVAHIRSF